MGSPTARARASNFDAQAVSGLRALRSEPTRLRRALKEVLSELDGLAGAKPFQEQEIAKALGAEVKSYPDQFESPQSITNTLSEMAAFHLPPDYLDTFLARLQATKPEVIGKAMADVVAKRDRVTVIVGDRKVVEPKLRALGYSQIQPVTYDGQNFNE